MHLLDRSVQCVGIRAHVWPEGLLGNWEISRDPTQGNSQEVQTCTLQALLPGSAGSPQPSGFVPSSMQPQWDHQA